VILRGRSTVVALVMVGLICSAAATVPASAGPVRGAVAGFSRWVDLADDHRVEWHRLSDDLTPEQQSEAIELADRLFGGLFGGYWNSLSGWDQAGGAHFTSRERVQRASAEIVEATRHYLMWRMAAIRAEEFRRDLSVFVAHDPAFWEAYGRHVAHGNHFGFLRERAAAVIPRMMAEAAVGDRLYDEGYYTPAGAHAMLAGARWSLERAFDRFERGDSNGGVALVTDAAKSMYRARSFGIPVGAVREVLSGGFGTRLASNESIVDYGGASFSFRGAVLDALGYWRAKAERKRGFDLQPLAELFLDAPTRKTAASNVELEERVVVTADAVNTNLESYLLRELAVVVDDAAGREVRLRYADLEVLGRMLFYAILQNEARPKDYDLVRGTCRTWLLSEHGIEASEQMLTKTMIGMGSRLLDVPGVLASLDRSRRGAKLVNRLVLLETAR